ncbi:lysoplasmalogenase family protein [Christiangramia forsetii]|uniref:Membrane protein n=1 Tax=Christiangramia forsetii (strain DSM 17595 / CGMCC 1.15422 / KT0803) TaxID=411154 RepID=A0LYL4_CHRFK|nr:lysoplasmalogenase family protein [Christiangramia forsetii]CAL65459.1 membrane protein [Christiangramia forsetii KT0803]
MFATTKRTKILPKSFLSAIIAILLVANFYIIFAYDLELSRWARLISTFVLFIVLVWQGTFSKRMLAAFFLLLISDLGLFNYEDPLTNAGTFLVRISAYLLLVFVVTPELKNLQTNLFQKILFIVVFFLNLGMLYLLVDMIPYQYMYPGLNILFYAYGISMITMVITAISYSNRYSDTTSFYFTAATLFLVFSDITSFIAYYLEFYEFYYPDRFFYILGIAGLVKFASFARSHKPVAELESL